MGKFRNLKPVYLNENTIKLIGSDWMLITAGKISSFNTMTASWGGLGVLWDLPVAFIFVRPTRYTFKFIEESNHYTLCFFEEKYRHILNFCGATSGRETDKIAKTGLIPVETEDKNIYFEQARLILECKKLYFSDINPDHFINKEIDSNYPKKDYHRLYIGEIINCWQEK